MKLLSSIAILALSSSIAYFAYTLVGVTKEVQKVREYMPALLKQVETVEKGVRIEAWLELAQQLDKQLPDVLQQLEKTRVTLNEVQQKIPAILSEVSHLRQQTVPSLLSEVKAVRSQTIPPLLNEVKAVRLMLPKTLKEMDDIVEKAKNVGEEAAEGAVQGTVKEIFTAPLNLIDDAEKDIFGDKK